MPPPERIENRIKQLEQNGWYLARIDDYAKKHGLSRSAFLVESARAAMAH